MLRINNTGIHAFELYKRVGQVILNPFKLLNVLVKLSALIGYILK